MKFFFLSLIAGLPLFLGAQPRRIVVAQDGSGDYATVQAAFDAVPPNNTKPVLIFVKRGVYKEKLHLDAGRNFVTLEGADPSGTVLTFDDHTGRITARGDTVNTYSSQSVLIAANDFRARGISFQNDAGFTAGQAVALRITGDRAAFRNCRFLGNQDVLFPSQPGTRQYFDHCYIEGTTDFIFGPSTAWFEHCEIHSKKNSHVTAASTPQETSYGYVFHKCRLTGDTSLHSVSLGRPWRPYSSVTYLDCYLGAHILPEGWNNWKNPANERTARYAEYRSSGPGSATARRFAWTRQLSAEEARQFTLRHVLGDWNPLAK